MTKKIFITGTDTDIGKTIVTAGTASLCTELGLRTAVLKPVQTGTAEYNPDICEIRRVAQDTLEIPDKLTTPYSFPYPASPHLAADMENTTISLDLIAEKIKEVELTCTPDVILIEGAGGILVPLNENETFLDLLDILGIPVIITSSVRLGTINHTLLTVQTLQNNRIPLEGIIFNRVPENPGPVEKDNIRIISKLSGLPVLASIPELEKNEFFTEKLRQEFLKPSPLTHLFSHTE